MTVGCSPVEQTGKCTALLDSMIMAAQGINANDVIEIRSHSGRSTLARVAVPLAKDKGKGVIRIDHYLRRVIKVAPAQEVDINRVAAQPVSKVFLKPLVHIPLRVEQLKSHIQNSLGADSLALGKGSIIRIVLPSALGSGAFEAVAVEPGPGIVTTNTQIEIVPEVESEQDHYHEHKHGLASDVTYDDVGGLSTEIKILRELLELPLRFPQAYSYLGMNPPRGIILHGSPGVGKTHLALALANEVDAHLFYINGPEIVSSQFGETETNLRNIFQEASHHTPSIILIDELDVIAPKRDETGSFTTTRTVAQLLALLDGLKKMEGVMVIGTTNRIDSLDLAIRRPGRFDQEIFLSPPDATGRLQILNAHSRGMPLSEEAASYLGEIARRAHGFVGADLMQLCRMAGLNALRRKFGDDMSYLDSPRVPLLEGLTVEKKDLEYAFGKIRPSALREVLVAVPDTTWGDIGGLQEAKAQLYRLAQMLLLQPETFATTRIKPSSGIVLYGPPSTGKTLLAEALARECQANFIPIKGPQVFSKWLGESEAEIRYIFQLARRVTPCIILFDQIDAIAPRRGRDTGTQAMDRVVNQLLVEMDSLQPGSRVVVVATTNRFDLIDPALLQTRRFGIHIHVPLPNEVGRKEILRIFLKNVLLDSKASLDEVVETLSASTEGFSGADLESVCYWGEMLAMDCGDFEKPAPLKLEHLKEALIKVKRSKLGFDTPSAGRGGESLG